VNIPQSTPSASTAGPSTSSATTTPTATSSSTSTTTITTTTTTTTIVPSHQVSGRVTDGEGTPVARALVTMGEARATTGPDGWFSLATVEPYEITVSKPGWTSTKIEWDEETTFYEATIVAQTIRGLRVAPESAGNDAAFQRLIELADETAINAFVFDTKRESGEVLYDTRVADAHDIGAVNVMYDPAARIAESHEHGLYTVSRIAAFEDDIRSEAIPEEHLAGTWVDPAADSARFYVLELAEEACEIGFDEIQFDYVRYPAGRTAEVSGQHALSQEERVGTITTFLEEARHRLNPMGCTVSAAVFGIIASSPDDQGLGQRPEEVSATVDVLSPMVYPSHYSPGWLGFDDPNDHPYDVTADAISDASSRMSDGSLLRPYLQAFWWTSGQIRRSIQAAEDAGIGWILWNILSNYDRAAIPTDAELAGE
jgi:hypothetical protein